MRCPAAIMAALLLALPCASPQAAEVKERTAYFTLRGTTLDDLDRELSRKGPRVPSTGFRHPGATQVKFSGRVTYQQNGRSCRVAKAELGLNLVKTLPRWTAPKAASKATAIVWKTLSDDIARHEGDHARIARLWLKKMESAVRNLEAEPTCEAMEARVNGVSATYLAEHERAQIRFDTVEGRDMNRRLKRLLTKNVAEAIAQRQLAPAAKRPVRTGGKAP